MGLRQNRNFWLQVAGAVISALGTAAAPVATAFAILYAGGSGTAIGLVSASGTLPALLFFVIGGVVADRLPRHHVIVAANLVSAVAQAVFAVVVFTHSVRLWELVLISAANGLAIAFRMPATEGLIMRSVDRAHASKAFAIFRTALNGAQVAGAALGGVVVSSFGPGWVLALDATTFVIACGLSVLMKAEGRLRRRAGMVTELKEGWGEFAGRRWLWSVVVQSAVVNAVGVGAFMVLGALAADRRLGGARDWGLILSCDAIGMIIGGLLMVRLRPRRLLVSGVCALVPLALPPAAFALGSSLVVICVASLLAGVGVEVFGVNWMTTLRQEVPHEKFSRVAAYEALGSFGLTPLGAAVAGPAADRFGLAGTLWCAAGAIVAATALVLTVPDVRKMERERG
ncbi:putative MFS family arabinose efflux permease [Labedaea rhizosphaerae]|uniref:Putative MFS family arabinose efflux permease n=1 Tax=Labedaea rhizosphaerae TaxID=598644 RepID=A0A4R6S5T1_LABRH|nr:putative MFS family arabinose efflux permease [Labedaea rhizosphaerae]